MSFSSVRAGGALSRLVPCLGFVVSVAAGCSSDSKEPQNEPKDAGGGAGGSSTTTDAGPLAPTMTNVFRKVILANNCQQAQCHGAGHAGNLSLISKNDAHDNLVGKPADGPCPMTPDVTCGCVDSGKTRVVANDPDSSLLIEKLSGTNTCGDRMPPTGELIPDAQLDLVKRWIEAGAPND